MAPPAKMRLRSEKHLDNITKRGNVPLSSKNREQGYAVGPFVLGLFIFIVIGSAILQIIRTAQMGQV